MTPRRKKRKKRTKLSLREKISNAKEKLTDAVLKELETPDVLDIRDLKMLGDLLINIEKTTEDIQSAEKFNNTLQKLVEKYNSVELPYSHINTVEDLIEVDTNVN